MVLPKAILFDLDGTLLDTARDLGAALNAVLVEHKLQTMPYEAYRPVASHGALGLLRLGFGDQLVEHDTEALRQQLLDYYHNNIAEHTCLFEDMAEFLGLLDHKGIPWGIVTNKPESLTLELIKHYPELSQCRAMVAGDTLSVRKPDPAPLIYAADQIPVLAKDCWYVGDAKRDIDAANAAGMISITAMYGYLTDQDRLENWQADYSVNNVGELNALLCSAE